LVAAVAEGEPELPPQLVAMRTVRRPVSAAAINRFFMLSSTRKLTFDRIIQRE
jgi:hypothetical protein